MLGVSAAGPSFASQLPVPPVPPSLIPNSEKAAPMPNNGIAAPVAEAATGPTIALKFYHSPNYEPGMGFTPGSRYRPPEDRKPLQTPGITINVPLK